MQPDVAFEYSFIQHLVYHHCVECNTSTVKCTSNDFTDIRMSIICTVPQKLKRREGHTQDKREEVKMASNKDKDSYAKEDWTNDEISLLNTMLEANPWL